MSRMDCTFNEGMNKMVTMERGMPKYLASKMIATKANLLLDNFLARTLELDNSLNVGGYSAFANPTLSTL